MGFNGWGGKNFEFPPPPEKFKKFKKFKWKQKRLPGVSRVMALHFVSPPPPHSSNLHKIKSVSIVMYIIHYTYITSNNTQIQTLMTSFNDVL